MKLFLLFIEDFNMIKIILGFIVIAGLAFYLLTKPGADIDMGGEKHGAEAVHIEEAKKDAPAAPAEAPAAAPAAPAADTKK